MYEDLTDLTVLKTAMETALNEYNLSPAVVPMQLVLFREAIEHSEHFLIPPPSQQPNYGVLPTKYGSLLRSLPNLFQIKSWKLPSSLAPDALVAMGGAFP